MLAPICTVGPSRPRARPAPMASMPPRNFTGSRVNEAGGWSPFNTASTWGMPLPLAWGEIRCTSEAAMAVAPAVTLITAQNPRK